MENDPEAQGQRPYRPLGQQTQRLLGQRPNRYLGLGALGVQLA